MSQWTHINGSAIIDSTTHDYTKKQLELFMQTDFPTIGSEGPAQYQINYIGYDYPSEKDMCALTSAKAFQLTFHGDLRDVGEEAIEIFKEFLINLNKIFGIRNMVFQIDVERKEKMIFYNNPNWDTVPYVLSHSYKY